MTSVIIAAYNEESVIGRCLTALDQQSTSPPSQIIVSANNCSDRTADIAEGFEVTVLDRPEPGKAAALNAADRVAKSFPRVYLDADIELPLHALDSVERYFAANPLLLAAVPRRHIDTAGRPWLVRSYFRVNEKLPAFTRGLFGRGMICLSEQGRQRFDQFPLLVADDLFLDSLFDDSEKGIVDAVVVTIAAPRRTRDLVTRLIRVRRGNADMRAAVARGELSTGVRQADRWAWLTSVVLHQPSLIVAAVPYLGISLVSALLAKRAPAQAWGRDESTRTLSPTRAEPY